MNLREDQILKLYTDCTKGHVWYIDGPCVPVSSGLSVAEFIKVLGARELPHIRVLGLAQNAELVVALWQLVETGQLKRLEIAGPNVCETEAERRDPHIALFRMRQCLLNPSLGGFHAATAGDYATYRLAVAVQRADTHMLAELVRQHPVWPDLAFLGNADPLRVAPVLTYLLDPRWFIDPQHPERTARAEIFMGVFPRVQSRVSSGFDSPEAEERRANAVFHAWQWQVPTVADAAAAIKDHRCHAVLQAWKWRTPTPAETERPEYFIWRRYKAAGEGATGDLRASQAFLHYLLRAWTQRLYNLIPGRPAVELFAPELMLQGWEAKAYRDHCAKQA